MGISWQISTLKHLAKVDTTERLKLLKEIFPQYIAIFLQKNACDSLTGLEPPGLPGAPLSIIDLAVCN